MTVKQLKILFQGDSITDAGRDKRNYHHMGNGYPRYAAEQIAAEHPDLEIEFINFGISGNRSGQLFDRLYTDGIAFAPDVISILIGINDVWHRYGGGRVATTDEQFALNYRCILERIRRETDAKIIMLQPYLLDGMTNPDFIRDKDKIKPIVDALAEEFADAYIRLDELFAEAMKTQPEPKFYSGDGVHPNENGARFIGAAYAEAIRPILAALR